MLTRSLTRLAMPQQRPGSPLARTRRAVQPQSSIGDRARSPRTIMSVQPIPGSRRSVPGSRRSVQGSRRSVQVSPPRSRQVSPPRSRQVSPPRSRQVSPPRSDRDRAILCARRPGGQRDRPRTRVEVSTSTGVSASRLPSTAGPSSPVIRRPSSSVQAARGKGHASQVIPGSSAIRSVHAAFRFTGPCSPPSGCEAAEAAALLHTGLQLPIALSRGKRFADLIEKLSKDSEEVAATREEREAVASLSLDDLKTAIFFHYTTCEHQFLSYNVIVRGITTRMVHPKMTLKRELIAIRTRCCSDGGKKFKFLYAIALDSALKGLATLLRIREEEECMDLDLLLGQSKTELLEWSLLYGSSHGRRK